PKRFRISREYYRVLRGVSGDGMPARVPACRHRAIRGMRVVTRKSVGHGNTRKNTEDAKNSRLSAGSARRPRANLRPTEAFGLVRVLPCVSVANGFLQVESAPTVQSRPRPPTRGPRAQRFAQGRPP